MIRFALAALALLAATPLSAQAPQPFDSGRDGASLAQDRPAASAFERLKALEGEWIDVDGAFGKKGAVVARYTVTGAGSTVVEAFPIGTPQEMTTMYHRDGTQLVLTHYCAGNQPRMRAGEIKGDVLEFAYDGGTNIDTAKTSHMHSARLEFVSKDEFRTAWQTWSNGKPGAVHALHLARKK